MASRSSGAEKRPGFFSTIKSLIGFTRKPYPWVVWVLPLILVAGIGIALGLAAVLQQSWWAYIFWGLTGLMAGMIFAMLLLNRLATKAMYAQIDGQMGAAGHVVSNLLGRKWRGGDEPVSFNPKSKDGVYRAVGRGGVVLVGEGSRKRLEKLIKKERTTARRITHDAVPVNVFYVGHDEDSVPIDRLAKTIKRLPKVVDRRGMAQLIARTDSISQGAMSSLPIPKGVDPMKVRAPKPR